MVTIRDVAKESGFSSTTVSIVLNSAPLARYIPATTKKRIESTAMAGALVPGPQAETGLYQGINSGPGYLVGAVSGIASRSQYVDFWNDVLVPQSGRSAFAVVTPVDGFPPRRKTESSSTGEMLGERSVQLDRDVGAVG